MPIHAEIVRLRVEAPLRILNYSIEYIDNTSGLMQNEVTALHMSPEHLLWIGTQQGLFRYSGRRLKAFLPQNDSLMNGVRILDFYRTRSNRILALNEYYQYSLLSEDQRTLTNQNEDNRGYLFFRHGSVGESDLIRWHGYHQYLVDSNRYYFDNDGESSALYYNDGYGMEEVPYKLTVFSREHLMVFGESMYVLQDDGAIIRINGLLVDTIGSVPDLVRPQKWTEDPLLSQMLWNAAENKAYLYRKGELYQFYPNEKEGLHLQLIARGIPKGEYSACVYSKEDARIFLGTRKKGLMIMSPLFIRQVVTDSTCAAGVPNYTLAAIGRDSVLSTLGILYSNSKVECEAFYGAYSGLLGFNSSLKQIYAVEEPSRPLLIDLENGDRRYLKVPVDSANVRTGHIIQRRGDVYMFIESIGLMRLEGDSLVCLASVPADKGEVNYAGQLFFLNDSTVWMLYGFKAQMVIFDLKTREGRVVRISEREDFNSRFLYRIGDKVLLTTYGKGIYVWENEHWSKLDLKGNLAMEACHGIRQVGDCLLFSTNQGLYVSPKELFEAYLDDQIPFPTFTAFSAHDGLRNFEFNGGGTSEPIISNLDGKFVIPNPDGVTYLDGDFKSFMPRYHAELILEEVYVDGQNLSIIENAELPPLFSNLMVKLLNPYYGDEENSPVYYRVPELNSEWREIDFEKGLLFDRLPSNGSYSLEIYMPFMPKQARIFRVWQFSVGPRFHETLAFFLIMGLVALFLILGLFELVQRRNRAYQQRLKDEIEKRTEEIARNNVSLAHTVADLQESRQQLNRAIGLRDRMITIFSHDIRGPLRFMADVAFDIKEKTQAKGMEDLSRDLEILSTSTRGAYETANTILEWIRNQDLKDSENQFPLGKAVDQVLDRKAAELMKYRILVDWDLKQDFLIATRPKALEIVVENIVENAIKYCAHKIWIRIFEEDQRICLEVTDDGPGIQDQKRLNAINSGVAVRSKGGQRGAVGLGVGLPMVREIIGQLNGTLLFQNAAGKGLQVRVCLPFYAELNE
ncbi:sensor histidine kinase [Croceimicrobium hydrocarbonivorans]|uniref:histidine kinase n=1 Tax=Croceimicrobium hydrocarbonivorans TaxID=2761580 RepID=A0A7H0VBJ8_9FLAO|nr:HAMP domain-containing sensor histidine kinase [Croceimicrobium hydrocarbonivorans]QNR23096.1 HAMP domain-containing histidine kinase [Croceimicrobium hydrocarbonivorans]